MKPQRTDAMTPTFRGLHHLLAEWRLEGFAVRALSVLFLFTLLLLSLNILVGALCPEYQRDSIWHHLAIPGQWIIRGDVAMFTHLKHSTFTLLVETLYVLLLAFGDTLFITAFISQIHLITFIVFLAIAYQIGDFRGLFLAMAFVPFVYATSFAVAPIPAKTDPVTILLLGLGWWRLVRIIDDASLMNGRELLIAGVICGGACAAKLSSLLFLVPLGICFLVAAILRDPAPRRIAALILWPSLGALAVLIPWFVRAGMYSGNPMIHVARGFLPITEEFLPVLRAYNQTPLFHPVTVDGIAEGFGTSLPKRMRIAATSLNILFFIIPVVALFGLAAKTLSIRVTAIGFLLAYAWWGPMLLGDGEELRYFSTCILAAALILAFFCKEIALRFGRSWLLPLVALVLFAGTGTTYVRAQIRYATLRTVDWPFRPIVSEHDRLEWLKPTAHGLQCHHYTLLDEQLPIDAHVLLLDGFAPFYLNRRASWCDDFTCPMIDDWWPSYSPFEAHTDLQARGVTHLLSESTDIDARVRGMADEGLIVPEPITGLPETWTVWVVAAD